MDVENFKALVRLGQREGSWWRALAEMREAYERNRMERFQPEHVPNLIAEGEELLAAFAVHGVTGKRFDAAHEAVRGLRAGQAIADQTLARARKNTGKAN